MSVSKKEVSSCPVDITLSVLDGRWKGTILWRLSDGPMRTSELRRSIPGVSERMLIRHLHEMVEVGILHREATGAPPSVRYSISRYGMTLIPLVRALSQWGRRHADRQIRMGLAAPR